MLPFCPSAMSFPVPSGRGMFLFNPSGRQRTGLLRPNGLGAIVPQTYIPLPGGHCCKPRPRTSPFASCSGSLCFCADCGKLFTIQATRINKGFKKSMAENHYKKNGGILPWIWEYVVDKTMDSNFRTPKPSHIFWGSFGCPQAKGSARDSIWPVRCKGNHRSPTNQGCPPHR